MGRQAKQIELFESEESELTRLRRRRNTAASLHLRAGIVLDCVKGYSGEDIAERHGVTQQTVSKWRNRFAKERVAGLTDSPRSGQPLHTNLQLVVELGGTLLRKADKGTVTPWNTSFGGCA